MAGPKSRPWLCDSILTVSTIIADLADLTAADHHPRALKHLLAVIFCFCPCWLLFSMEKLILIEFLGLIITKVIEPRSNVALKVAFPKW